MQRGGVRTNDRRGFRNRQGPTDSGGQLQYFERLSRYGTITRGTVPHTLATVIAVGLTGSDVSFDAGLHWHTFDTGQFDTVSCAPDGSCWASGDLGRVAILQR